MNDTVLKQLLADSITPAPSGNFNQVVLSSLPPRRKKQRHYLSLDEPLLLVILLLAAPLLLLLLLYPALYVSTAMLVLALAGITLFGIFIILFNLVTRKSIHPMTADR